MLLALLLALCVGSQGFLLVTRRCYGKYGCFTNHKPFNNAKGFLPESPEDQGIQFLLYTRRNPTHAQILDEERLLSVQQSHFNRHHKTRMLIHGFTGSAHDQWVRDMTHELLQNEDMNVIAVNWEKGADKINYFHVAANTRVVGAVTAELVKTLHSVGAAYSNFHLIGHSLGSHISGYVGEIVHGLGRITGLDPAGPLFENFDPVVRLDPTDANFVDVIHTDAESLLQLGLGMMKAIGDADYYPNGGVDQPGCPRHHGHHFINLITGSFPKLTDGAACSHNRAVSFFISSINNRCQYTSHPCVNQNTYDRGHCNTCAPHGCQHMGYHASPAHHGRFYLKTSAQAPHYC
ncbi:pancreatic lipase-related protein 2-like isoform X2 [Haliotis rufescens]|uniref:pancreatic lipase-related protein 2-like isoform X1 n=1 Tax=Haliotis rufescens TaxID=6454 RepID=UPI00201F9F5E|nr:pancreatic lipase-related protein 2-like isoform X1 [Haliotis rufescens]XP_046330860.2 pancreatic lipase-related protein 2-like isoform X2 [Haliotis rufescens]